MTNDDRQHRPAHPDAGSGLGLSRRSLLRGSVMAAGVAATGWSLHQGTAQARSRGVPPRFDAYVSAAEPDTVFAGTDDLLTFQPPGGARQQVSYLTFPVAPLGSGPTALRLRGANGLEWAAEVSVHAVPDADWSEATLTWNTRPAVTAEPLDSRLVDGLDLRDYEWDVTAAVEAARSAGSRMVSLAVVYLRSVITPTRPVTFVAREGRDGRPVVHNAVAAPERRTVVQSKVDTANTYRPYLADTVGAVDGFTPDARTIAVSDYGGRNDITLAATGFFRTQRGGHPSLGDGWTLVDPEGHPFYAVGVASVFRFAGPAYDPNDPASEPNPDEDAYRAEYGTDDARWARETLSFIRGLGFNSTGGFSDDAITRQDPAELPYSPTLAVMNLFAEQIGVADPGYGNSAYLANSMPVWHPGFPAFAETYLAEQLAAWADDPWLVGYWTDNELPVSTNALADLLTGTNNGGDPKLAESKTEAERWIVAQRGGSVDLTDPKITDAEAGAWHGHVLDRYYQVIEPLFRRFDPNHLLLGSRLHSRAPRDPAIVEAVGRYVDVLSFNYYERWDARAQDLDMWQQVAPDSPALVTEFYVKGEDTGFPAEIQDLGAGWIVPTQADRGVWYQNITLGMLAHPHLVGWHNFKFRENAEDANKGLVDIRFEPYTAFTAPVAELNRNAYALREHFFGRGRR